LISEIQAREFLTTDEIQEGLKLFNEIDKILDLGRYIGGDYKETLESNPDYKAWKAAALDLRTKFKEIQLRSELIVAQAELAASTFALTKDIQSPNLGTAHRTILARVEELKREIENLKRFGGIDFNNIGVERQGRGIDVKFDPAKIDPVLKNRIQGFTPVIINITPLPSLIPILGLDLPQDEDGQEVAALELSKAKLD
jgi:hypothetical protein